MLLTPKQVGQTHYFEERGWNGKTLVPLPDVPQRFLQVWTYQRSDGVETYADGMEKQGDYLHFHVGEFCQCVFETHPEHVTEKIVREQHERALAMLDAIVRYATAYYIFREAVAKAA